MMSPGSTKMIAESVPAAEAMVDAMLTSTNRPDFVAAVHALDRVLTAGRYVIPVGFAPVSHLAHDKALKFPAKTPIYGDYPGFLPETWWREGGAS